MSTMEKTKNDTVNRGRTYSHYGLGGLRSADRRSRLKTIRGLLGRFR